MQALNRPACLKKPRRLSSISAMIKAQILYIKVKYLVRVNGKRAIIRTGPSQANFLLRWTIKNPKENSPISMSISGD